MSSHYTPFCKQLLLAVILFMAGVIVGTLALSAVVIANTGSLGSYSLFDVAKYSLPGAAVAGFFGYASSARTHRKWM